MLNSFFFINLTFLPLSATLAHHIPRPLQYVQVDAHCTVIFGELERKQFSFEWRIRYFFSHFYLHNAKLIHTENLVIFYGIISRKVASSYGLPSLPHSLRHYINVKYIYEVDVSFSNVWKEFPCVQEN